jgi:hypothetical protein
MSNFVQGMMAGVVVTIVGVILGAFMPGLLDRVDNWLQRRVERHVKPAGPEVEVFPQPAKAIKHRSKPAPESIRRVLERERRQY